MLSKAGGDQLSSSRPGYPKEGASFFRASLKKELNGLINGGYCGGNGFGKTGFYQQETIKR